MKNTPRRAIILLANLVLISRAGAMSVPADRVGEVVQSWISYDHAKSVTSTQSSSDPKLYNVTAVFPAGESAPGSFADDDSARWLIDYLKTHPELLPKVEKLLGGKLSITDLLYNAEFKEQRRDIVVGLKN